MHSKSKMNSDKSFESPCHDPSQEKKSRGKKGAIVNIGSGAATVLPSDPLYAVYAGTKAYVDQMTQCLSL